MLQFQYMRQFRPSLKQILLGGLGSGIGILGVLFAVAVYVVELIIHPKKAMFGDSYTFSPYELDLPAEEVVFPPHYGDYQVRGWYIPRPNATTTILVCPGYRTGMSDVLGISALLWKAGHNILAFEYYGHGKVVGRSVTLGFREINDFHGAVAYAKERDPQVRLGVIAYSMGAAVAIMSCARNTDVEALVLDSAFATHHSAVDYNFRQVFHLPSAPFVWLADYLLWWRAGYRFSQVEPLRDITRIAPRPVLLIHSLKDSIVDPHDASLLYDAAGEPKELWLVPGVDHCGAYFADRAAYTAKVTGFFERYLKNSSRLHLVEQAPGEPGEAETTGSDSSSLDEHLSEAS
jgi:fermentation-respiration switch protein FrsA (DUF1100 family)